MAGGKETPRQKMIGMMYLVLTALLALNVSKEIINAFVTLNNNIESGNKLINSSNDQLLGSFGRKIISLKSEGGSEKEIARLEKYQKQAVNVRLRTQGLSNFYVQEAADMISKVEAHPEGGDWFEADPEMDPLGDNDSEWLKLKNLHDINAKDNYDVPTYEFIGGNISSPKARGLAIVDSLHTYRDFLISTLANYPKNEDKPEEGSWSYEPVDIRPPLDGQWSEVDGELKEAFANCNPEDTSSLVKIYKMITLPEKFENHGEEIPYISGQFDHAPLVAAVAVFTSLRSKLLQAESIALGILANKVEVATFNFNKIEPLAFSGSSYINQGDSLGMRVMIAAYDSTAPMKLQYWVNDSTRSPDGMKTYEGDADKPLVLPGDQTGDFTIYGDIEVEIKGSKEWKPWKYTYKVGKPGAAIALPEMLTLYKGYENKVKVSASGYPPDAISASCSGCASFSKSGEFYIAKPVLTSNSPVTVSVSARTEDGGSVGIAKEQLSVTDFPVPTVLLAGSVSGSKLTRRQINGGRKVLLKLVGSPLKASFTVNSFSVIIGNKKVKCSGSSLSNEAMALVGRMQPGQTLSIQDVNYSGTGTKRVVSGSFEIR